MTLKERIKKELINMLQEEAAVNFDRGTMFDSMDEVIATLGGMAELHGTRQPKVAEKLASIVSQLQQLKGQLAEGEKEDPLKYVDPENRPMSPEETLAKARAQGERHGKAERQGRKIKLHSYDKKDVQAAYLDGYKKGKAAKLPYAEGKSITYGMPRLQGTAKEIDDLIGAAIDAHMKADRFRQLGSKEFAAHMDQAVPKALAAVEQLLPEMNRIAIEKTMPHLAKALSASGEERLAALGKAKDALVPR